MQELADIMKVVLTPWPSSYWFQNSLDKSSSIQSIPTSGAAEKASHIPSVSMTWLKSLSSYPGNHVDQ
jgi:hypothetical protein